MPTKRADKTIKTPSVEESAFLVRCARAYGRTWKSTLRKHWETGYIVSPHSATLRNNFGPSWLAKFKGF